jgi:hypothetical protein
MAKTILSFLVFSFIVSYNKIRYDNWLYGVKISKGLDSV